MTESPQQPGYSATQQHQQQQQHAAYAAQQQPTYAPQQAYGPPAPNPFEKLPMNMLTLGLASAGALLLLLGSMILGAENSSIPGLVVGGEGGGGSFALLSLYAIIALTGITITTGPAHRNVYRVIVTGLVALEIGNLVAQFLGDGKPDEAASIIGIVLYILALGCLTAATYTMAAPVQTDPNQLAAMQAAQQQHQGYPQQHGQPQYPANPQVQQPTSEQPTTWQHQQPPQQ